MNKTIALFVFLLGTGLLQANEVNKGKLRQLAELPDLSFTFGVLFSQTHGLFLPGETSDPMREIASLRKELKADASDAERYLRLSILYKEIDHQKESDEAAKKTVAICRRQVKEHPEDPAWLVRLAQGLLDAGQKDEGEKLLRRVIEKAPTEWRAWLILAKQTSWQSLQTVQGKGLHLIWQSQGVMINSLRDARPTARQLDRMRELRTESWRYYTRAIQLAATEAEPYFQRANSRWMHACLEAAIAQDEAGMSLAATLMSQCAEDTRQLARIQPQDPKAVAVAFLMEYLAQSAQCQGKSGSLSRASQTFVRWCMEQLWQRALQQDHNAAVAAELLAESLLAMQRANEGREGEPGAPTRAEVERAEEGILQLLRRAVALEPSRDRAWDALTGTLVGKGDEEQAIRVGEKRLSLKDNAHNHFFLAWTYAAFGHLDTAIEQLRAGLTSDPSDLSCRFGLATLLLARDDADSLAEAGVQLDVIAKQLNEKEANRGSQAQFRFLTADAIEKQWREDCSDDHWEDRYLFLRGLQAGLNDQDGRAKELFESLLQHDKDNKNVRKALAALGD